MRRLQVVTVTSILALALAVPCWAQGESISVKAAFRRAIEGYLADQAGRGPDAPRVEFKAIGSWTDEVSPKFRDPMGDLRWVDGTGPTPSDFDLTMVIQGVDDADEAGRLWQEAQRDIRRRLQSELAVAVKAADLPAAETARLQHAMSRVNDELVAIYPPAQLVANAEAKEVAAICKRYGYPKPSDAAGDVEGLFNDAARAWAQNLEATHGKAFFYDTTKKRMMSGAADLSHLIEGYGRWRPAETASLAAQLADKTRSAIVAGDGPGAVKNAQRLRDVLSAAQEMGGYLPDPDDDLDRLLASVPKAGNPYPNTKFNELTEAQRKEVGEASVAYTKKAQAWLESHADELDEHMQAARATADVLGAAAAKYGNRRVPIGQLQRLWKSPRFVAIRRQAAAYAAASGRSAATVGRYLLVVAAVAAVAFQAAPVVDAYGEGGVSPALQQSVVALVRAVNLPGDLVLSVLEEVRLSSVGLVTGYQDCSNMMAGIYEVKGGEAVGTGWQVEELARAVHAPDVVIGLVAVHARRAAARSFAAASAAGERLAASFEDDKAAQLIERCTPVVLEAWQGARLHQLTPVGEALEDLRAALSSVRLVIEGDEADVSDQSRAVQVKPVVMLPGRQLDSSMERLRLALKAFNAESGKDVPVGGWETRIESKWLMVGRDGNESELARASDVTTYVGHGSYDPYAHVPAAPTVVIPFGEQRTVKLALTLDVRPGMVHGELYDPRGASIEQVFAEQLHIAMRYEPVLTVSGPLALSDLDAQIVDRTTGKPVAGARLVLSREGEAPRVAAANADGRVRIADVPFGRYRIAASATGYRTSSQDPFAFTRARKRGVVRLTPEDAAVAPAPQAAANPPTAAPDTGGGATTTRRLSFGRDFIPLSATPSPQVFSHEVPGPGTLSVTFTYTPLEHVTLEYGAGRTEASMRWTSPTAKGLATVGPVVRVKGGVAVSEPASKTVSIATSGRETFVFSVMPEVTMAYQYQGKWVDLNSRTWSTHHHLLAASGTITITFTPSAPKP